ncbi:MAG: YraN family protein [Atopobiaceae bacterium]|nr:YraN family protein [Atopobiaceae bacterium]
MTRDSMAACAAREEEAAEVVSFERYPRLFEGKDVTCYTQREVGLEGENLAAHRLEILGYEILDRNWRCPWGEADIIALDGGDVVLVEVKTRVDINAVHDVIPELAVNAQKRERYAKIALAYLGDHPGLFSVRFDVIAIVLVSDDHARLRHFVNAFSWED